MKREGIWYLAHPVASDSVRSFKENMSHSLKVARVIWDAGFRIIMPWHTHCLFLDDSNLKHRTAGLNCNLVVAKRCRGIILTGHRISTGMQKELDVAKKAHLPVLDLTGVEDERLYDTALHYRQRYFDEYVER